MRVELAVVLSLGCTPSRPTSPTPPTPQPTEIRGKLLPSRIRRLSNAELERTVDSFLGVDAKLTEWLPPDVRQSGYSINAGPPVSATLATRLAQHAPELARRSLDRGRWPVCLRKDQNEDDCRDAFLRQAARGAFRRPPTEAELAVLRELFDVEARERDNRLDGAELVLSTLIQSPSFLYLNEIGEGTDDQVRLTPFETASVLSYSVWGGPPDDALLEAAERGDLETGAGRVHQARRLLGHSDARHHFRQFVLEWLEVDTLMRTAKDPAQFPTYDTTKHHMLAETRAFVDEVMVYAGGSFETLLAGGFTAIDPTMAEYYGLTAQSVGPRVSLKNQGRIGVLQHASFLAAHAHPDSSSPVKRGDFVLRKVLCVVLPRPVELDIEVVIPPPSETLTTRARFEAHATDPACAACHTVIDPLGFTFESFDAGGRRRRRELGGVVDVAVEYELHGVRRTFENSAALSRWLADSAQARACFAKQAFRYWTGQADPDVEATFTGALASRPLADQESLLQLLLLYVASDLFVMREATR